jgi:orotidine-5'-phosphate decarboxylase
MKNAVSKLESKAKEAKFICVGLDSDIKKIPGFLLERKDPILEFNKIIIEKTIEHAGSYKLNFAFYESLGEKGLEILRKTVEFIGDDILIIGDAKRGDIGNTSQMYADAVFRELKFDAITAHPYMGTDSVSPFLSYEGKLVFILALTSNPGAADFEKLKLENGSFLYQQVIEQVKKWNVSDNCGIVFGATQLEELKQNISRFGNLPVLLPGVGAQGGSFEDVCAVFKAENKSRFMVNISRGLIYLSGGANFGELAEKAIIGFNNKAKEIFI